MRPGPDASSPRLQTGWRLLGIAVVLVAVVAEVAGFAALRRQEDEAAADARDDSAVSAAGAVRGALEAVVGTLLGAGAVVGADGGLRPATRRLEYCPVIDVAPRTEATQAVIGLDTCNDPLRGPVRQRAASSFSVVLSTVGPGAPDGRGDLPRRRSPTVAGPA